VQREDGVGGAAVKKRRITPNTALAKLLWQAYLQAYIQHNTYHDKKEWGELLSSERQVLEAVAARLIELGVTVADKPQAPPPRRPPSSHRHHTSPSRWRTGTTCSWPSRSWW
jgi:hypothetical protein